VRLDDARPEVALTVRGGALRVAAWTAGAATSLVSIPLLVRHLGVADFGRYVAVLSIVNIAALASDLGIGALALREWSAREPGTREDVLRALLGLRMAAATLGAVAALVFVLAADYPGRVVAGTGVAAVGLFAQVFGDFALVVLAGALRFGRVALVELSRSLLGTAGVVVLVVAGSGLVPFFAAYSLASVCAAGLAIALARGGARLVPRMRLHEWRPLLADTAAYAAATAVYVVYFRAIMVVVSLAASAHQAGLFAAAYRLVEFVAAVAGALAATATPMLARLAARNHAALGPMALRVSAVGAALGVVVAVALALLAGPLMDVIGGARTDGAAPVLRIEAIAVATTFAAFGMGAVLLVLRRYRELLLVNLSALAVALAAALALVPAHGARGGAIAAVAGEAVLAAGQALALGRALRRRLPA
jgi:O-antigen/teichoic acid export membrane protein